jgi:hypothetical protein
MGSKIMSYTVQFKFEVTVGSATDEDSAKEAAKDIAKHTFGWILFKEFTDPEVFID